LSLFLNVIRTILIAFGLLFTVRSLLQWGGVEFELGGSYLNGTSKLNVEAHSLSSGVFTTDAPKSTPHIVAFSSTERRTSLLSPFGIQTTDSLFQSDVCTTNVFLASCRAVDIIQYVSLSPSTHWNGPVSPSTLPENSPRSINSRVPSLQPSGDLITLPSSETLHLVATLINSLSHPSCPMTKQLPHTVPVSTTLLPMSTSSFVSTYSSTQTAYPSSHHTLVTSSSHETSLSEPFIVTTAMDTKSPTAKPSECFNHDLDSFAHPSCLTSEDTSQAYLVSATMSTSSYEWANIEPPSITRVVVKLIWDKITEIMEHIDALLSVRLQKIKYTLYLSSFSSNGLVPEARTYEI
jgi:hypothetical protein